MKTLTMPIILALTVLGTVVLVLTPSFIVEPSNKTLIDTNFVLGYGSMNSPQKQFNLTLNSGEKLNIQTTVDSESFMLGIVANFYIMNLNEGGSIVFQPNYQYSAIQEGTWTAQSDGNYALLVSVTSGCYVQVHLQVNST